MKLWSVALAFAVGVVACSSNHAGGISGSNDLEGNGSGSSGDSSGSGSSSGSGNSGSGGSGSAASGSVSQGDPMLGADAAVHTLYADAEVPDGDVDEPVTLTMDSFTVQPGQEVYMCQQFANPFGRDVDIVKMDGYMTAGSHHFFLFNMAPKTFRNTAAPLGTCPGMGLEFHPFPYLSQTDGHYVTSFPPDAKGIPMGYPIASANGLMMNAHYLNSGATAITPTVSITIWPARAGVVQTHVGSIFLNNTSIHVPAAPTTAWYSAQQTPILDESYTIFTNWAHLHTSSDEFQASTGGQVFYDLKSDLTEPPLQTSSAFLPLQMAKGASISWQCEYTGNGTDRPFGDSAAANVMCIYIGQYYPADQGSPDYPDIISAVN